jgi:hypothetical protein
MLARETVTGEEGGRLVTRVGTNACRARFLNALRDAGLLTLVDAIDGFHEDRARGGLGYFIMWQQGVTLEDVRGGLEGL